MITDDDNPNESSENSEEISQGNLVLAVILAPLTSLCLVILITNGIQFIAQEQWPGIPILWPPVLYLGGIVGGAIGGIVTLIEIRTIVNQNQPLTPVQLFSSDLFYLTLLMLLTYVLELLSENLIFQGMLFILEIAFFVVIGRNISRKSLEMITMTEDTENQEIESESEAKAEELSLKLKIDEES
ncbi:MAG: hypothetical protein ACFFDC_04790 [Promethearchaeota archaeon]